MINRIKTKIRQSLVWLATQGWQILSRLNASARQWGTFVVVSILIILVWNLIIPNSQINTESSVVTKLVANEIVFSVNGSLEQAVIAQGEREVRKGDIFLVYYDRNVVTRLIHKKMPVKKIPVQEIICFTQTGKTGYYWLGESSPTVIEVQEDGTMNFELCYPDTFSNFATATKKAGKTVQDLVKIKFEKTNSLPSHFSRPRHITRLNSLAGVLLPEIQVQTKYPDFDLDKEIGRK